MKQMLMGLFLLTQTLFAQTFERVPVMSEDLGAYKWVMTGKAGPQELVIFRVKKMNVYRNGKTTTEIQDTVVCPIHPEEIQKQTAFFYNPQYFDTPRGTKWSYKIPSVTGSIEGHVSSYFLGNNKAEISFIDKELGETKMLFSVIIITYEKAKKLHPELPKIKKGSGWTWSGSLNEE